MKESYFKRIPSEEEFRHWLSLRDEKITKLKTACAIKLDYSMHSIIEVEKWLVEEYPSLQSAQGINDKERVEAVGIYFGESFKYHFAGVWFLETSPPDAAYLGYPGIRHFKDSYPSESIFPLFWATTALSRRTGHFTFDRFENLFNRKVNKNEDR